MLFREFSDLTPTQLKAVRSIYEEAFPEWQRQSFESLLQLSANPRRLQLAAVADGNVIGISVSGQLSAVPWSLLEYFAVDARERSHGLGSTMWDDLVHRIRLTNSHSIAFEVEDPAAISIDRQEQIRRSRRVEFYRRLGAFQLPVPEYRIPYLTGSGLEPMLLFGASVTGHSSPSGKETRELVGAIYDEAYGLDRNDPTVASAIKSIPDDQAGGAECASK